MEATTVGELRNLYSIRAPDQSPRFVMVGPNPFETTGKFGVVWVAVGVCDGKMADGAGFEPAIRFPVYTLSKRAP